MNQDQSGPLQTTSRNISKHDGACWETQTAYLLQPRLEVFGEEWIVDGYGRMDGRTDRWTLEDKLERLKKE